MCLVEITTYQACGHTVPSLRTCTQVKGAGQSCRANTVTRTHFKQCPACWQESSLPSTAKVATEDEKALKALQRIETETEISRVGKLRRKNTAPAEIRRRSSKNPFKRIVRARTTESNSLLTNSEQPPKDVQDDELYKRSTTISNVARKISFSVNLEKGKIISSPLESMGTKYEQPSRTEMLARTQSISKGCDISNQDFGTTPSHSVEGEFGNDLIMAHQSDTSESPDEDDIRRQLTPSPNISLSRRVTKRTNEYVAATMASKTGSVSSTPLVSPQPIRIGNPSLLRPPTQSQSKHEEKNRGLTGSVSSGFNRQGSSITEGPLQKSCHSSPIPKPSGQQMPDGQERLVSRMSVTTADTTWGAIIDKAVGLDTSPAKSRRDLAQGPTSNDHSPKLLRGQTAKAFDILQPLKPMDPTLISRSQIAGAQKGQIRSQQDRSVPWGQPTDADRQIKQRKDVGDRIRWQEPNWKGRRNQNDSGVIDHREITSPLAPRRGRFGSLSGHPTTRPEENPQRDMSQSTPHFLGQFDIKNSGLFAGEEDKPARSGWTNTKLAYDIPLAVPQPSTKNRPSIDVTPRSKFRTSQKISSESPQPSIDSEFDSISRNVSGVKVTLAPAIMTATHELPFSRGNDVTGRLHHQVVTDESNLLAALHPPTTNLANNQTIAPQLTRTERLKAQYDFPSTGRGRGHFNGEEFKMSKPGQATLCGNKKQFQIADKWSRENMEKNDATKRSFVDLRPSNWRELNQMENQKKLEDREWDEESRPKEKSRAEKLRLEMETHERLNRSEVYGCKLGDGTWLPFKDVTNG